MSERSSGFNENEGRVERLSAEESRLFTHLIPRRNKEAIKIDDPAFGFYDPKKIENDRARVVEEKKTFERKNAQDPAAEAGVARGKLFEAMIEDQIGSSNWMGPEANVIVPSEYDDYVNYVDTIIEFERPGHISHLALGVDITNSAEKEDQKFDGIKRSIQEGRLSAVEYFKSAHLTGRLDKVPQVIIGADAKTRTEVMELMLQYKVLKENTSNSPARHEEFKKVREKLERHPLQFKILYLIQAQLEAFSAYARKLGKEDIALIYENTNQIIKGILKLKEPPEGRDDFEYEDEVFGLTIRYARELARASKS
jgi:hypothetical protein